MYEDEAGTKIKIIVLKDYLKNTRLLWLLVTNIVHWTKFKQIKNATRKCEKRSHRKTQRAISWSFVHKIGVWMMWSKYLGFNEYRHRIQTTCVCVYVLFYVFKRGRAQDPRIMQPCNEHWACHVKTSKNIWQIAHCIHKTIIVIITTKNAKENINRKFINTIDDLEQMVALFKTMLNVLSNNGTNINITQTLTHTNTRWHHNENNHISFFCCLGLNLVRFGRIALSVHSVALLKNEHIKNTKKRMSNK